MWQQLGGIASPARREMGEMRAEAAGSLPAPSKDSGGREPQGMGISGREGQILTHSTVWLETGSQYNSKEGWSVGLGKQSICSSYAQHCVKALGEKVNVLKTQSLCLRF